MISEVLALALRYYQAGQLQQAEQLYRQILEIDPNHADAWHLLGEIAIRRGQNDVAIDYIGRAIRLSEWFPHYHNNLGSRLRRQRQNRGGDRQLRARSPTPAGLRRGAQQPGNRAQETGQSGGRNGLLSAGFDT
jgi:protein O-GlcNAc transferase